MQPTMTAPGPPICSGRTGLFREVNVGSAADGCCRNFVRRFWLEAGMGLGHH